MVKKTSQKVILLKNEKIPENLEIISLKYLKILTLLIK